MGNSLLDLQSKNKLAQKLLACRSFKDRQLRNRIIKDLDFCDRIERSDTDFDDVMNIVRSALYYVGGLDKLLQVLEIYEGRSSLPMAGLKSTVQLLTLTNHLSSIIEKSYVDDSSFDDVMSSVVNLVVYLCCNRTLKSCFHSGSLLRDGR